MVQYMVVHNDESVPVLLEEVRAVLFAWTFATKASTDIERRFFIRVDSRLVAELLDESAAATPQRLHTDLYVSPWCGRGGAGFRRNLLGRNHIGSSKRCPSFHSIFGKASVFKVFLNVFQKSSETRESYGISSIECSFLLKILNVRCNVREAKVLNKGTVGHGSK